MTLGTQVVDLFRLDVAQQCVDRACVVQVAVMEKQAHILFMGIAIDMIDAAGVEGGGTADHAVDFVTFLKQQFGQIRTILTGDASDQCFLHVRCSRLLNRHLKRLKNLSYKV